MRPFVFLILVPCVAPLTFTANCQTVANNCETIEGEQNKAACTAQGDVVMINCAVPRDVNETSLCRGAFANSVVSSPWPWHGVEAVATSSTTLVPTARAPPHAAKMPGSKGKLTASAPTLNQTLGKCPRNACRHIYNVDCRGMRCRYRTYAQRSHRRAEKAPHVLSANS
jgi:hypothetical protein